MSKEIRGYYNFPENNPEQIKGAGLVWFLSRDYLSPSYENSDEIALNAAMWREGGRRRVLRLIEAMGLKSGDRVLDLGSGLGGPARDIEQATQGKVVRANLSIEQLKSDLALSKAINQNGRYLVNADAHSLPFQNASFDHIYSINAFYHFTNPEQVIREIQRILKQGGKFGLDDWFLTDQATEITINNLRCHWSSDKGFHHLTEILKYLADNNFRVENAIDYTREASRFLTEERFGISFIEQVRPQIINAFPKLYPDFNLPPEAADRAANQLKEAILYMGELYRSGQVVYQQLIADKK